MSGGGIRKAVIPAAGFGTRFLPFTKSVPKELIPVVDKPVIQYVVEEAVRSGIEEILIILSEGKEAVRGHFSPAPALERRLEETKKTKLIDELRAIGGGAKIEYVYQHDLNGLGGAVLLAEEFAAGESFAVLLGDTILSSATDVPVTGQLMELHDRYAASVIAVEEVPAELVPRYGIIGGRDLEPGVLEISTMVEKPAVQEAPSRLAVASRYILPYSIFAALKHTPRGKGNEVQLTDAIRSLLGAERFVGGRIAGRRHDIGDKLSFLENTVEFALKRPEFREEFLKYLENIVIQQKKEE